jgi:hypothetical protein
LFFDIKGVGKFCQGNDGQGNKGNRFGEAEGVKQGVFEKQTHFGLGSI